MGSLTLPLPSSLMLTPFPRWGGGGGGDRPDSRLSQNRCPHKHAILYGIRDISERLRNVKVAYIVIT